MLSRDQPPADDAETKRGPRARRMARRPRDPASRDQAGRAADLESGSGSGASGARGASSERTVPARGGPGRGAARRGPRAGGETPRRRALASGGGLALTKKAMTLQGSVQRVKLGGAGV